MTFSMRRGKGLGERGVGDDVLNTALGVGSDHTDAERGRCVERVRESDFAGLQAVLVHHVLLGGEDEPDSLVLDGAILVIGVIHQSKSSWSQTSPSRPGRT